MATSIKGVSTERYILIHYITARDCIVLERIRRVTCLILTVEISTSGHIYINVTRIPAVQCVHNKDRDGRAWVVEVACKRVSRLTSFGATLCACIYIYIY